MATIKISSKVEQAVWDEFKLAASESNQNISGMLTDALTEYLQRRRIRPVVRDHIMDSIRDNEALGKLLAK